MSHATVEAWARDYIATTDLEQKFDLDAVPHDLDMDARPLRIEAPGRPASLRVAEWAPKTPGREALRTPARRAQMIHAFLHHELQAAELFAWALLAFADAPLAFRRGLVAIAKDEIRHMGLYRAHLEALGSSFGEFPVRDWFWQRVPSCSTAASFVATLGVGFEGANLDHAVRFSERFRAVGDTAGADLQERVAAEEIPHVRFALLWLAKFTGSDEFSVFREHLPPPLSPLVMRGEPMNRVARTRAGMSAAFVDELATWAPTSLGS